MKQDAPFRRDKRPSHLAGSRTEQKKVKVLNL